jgi:hypothetical protein
MLDRELDARVRLVLGDQTRLCVTHNTATEWIFCASGGRRRVLRTMTSCCLIRRWNPQKCP